MNLIHDKPKPIRIRECECPSCRNRFRLGSALFFPREIWHPFRTYTFLRGFICTACGYLISKQQVEKQYE